MSHDWLTLPTSCVCLTYHVLCILVTGIISYCLFFMAKCAKQLKPERANQTPCANLRPHIFYIQYKHCRCCVGKWKMNFFSLEGGSAAGKWASQWAGWMQAIRRSGPTSGLRQECWLALERRSTQGWSDPNLCPSGHAACFTKQIGTKTTLFLFFYYLPQILFSITPAWGKPWWNNRRERS